MGLVHRHEVLLAPADGLWHCHGTCGFHRFPRWLLPGGLLPYHSLRRESSSRETVLCRFLPGARAHRWGCRATLSVREEPWARRDRQREVLRGPGGTLARCRTKRSWAHGGPEPLA